MPPDLAKTKRNFKRRFSLDGFHIPKTEIVGPLQSTTEKIIKWDLLWAII
jgi:hypothetical protein